MRELGSVKTVSAFSAAFACMLMTGCLITLNPVMDTHVIDTDPFANFCRYDCMIVQNLGTGIARSYLQFDTSTVSGTVNSAMMTVHLCQGCGPAGATVKVFEVRDVWDHCLLDWMNQPPHTLTAEDFDTCGGLPSIQLDVTDLVRKWVDDPASNFGVVLMVDENVPGDFFSLHAVDSTDLPELTIDYTP